MSEIKQVIVVRTDLRNTEGQKVRTGKLFAQVSHASMAFLTNRIKEKNRPQSGKWLTSKCRWAAFIFNLLLTNDL